MRKIGKHNLWCLMMVCLSATLEVAGQETQIGTSASQWALGPFVRPQQVNPILEPQSESTFNCPMHDGPVKWEEGDVFNPAAVTKDGNIVVVEPDEEIKGMTEDEIQQQSDEVDQMLQDIINGASGNPSDPGDEGNNSSGQISTGNPNNQDNTGTGNQDNTEQEVYEGDTENTVDNSQSLEELEQAMKDAMEENNGVGSTTGPLTEETIEGITGSIELVP